MVPSINMWEKCKMNVKIEKGKERMREKWEVCYFWEVCCLFAFKENLKGNVFQLNFQSSLDHLGSIFQPNGSKIQFSTLVELLRTIFTMWGHFLLMIRFLPCEDIFYSWLEEREATERTLPFRVEQAHFWKEDHRRTRSGGGFRSSRLSWVGAKKNRGSRELWGIVEVQRGEHPFKGELFLESWKRVRESHGKKKWGRKKEEGAGGARLILGQSRRVEGRASLKPNRFLFERRIIR